jgi:hypothetical protein
MTNVVFDNPLLFVIDYPDRNAVEIFDKRSRRMGFVSGALADRFRHDFGILLAEQPDDDRFEEFMDDYEAVLNQSPTVH